MRKIDINAASVALSMTASSARVALAGSPSSFLMVDNSFPGALDCYLKSGNSAVTAATTDMHIAAGEKAVYEIDPSHTHVAGISTAANTVRLVRGNGE